MSITVKPGKDFPLYRMPEVAPQLTDQKPVDAPVSVETQLRPDELAAYQRLQQLYGLSLDAFVGPERSRAALHKAPQALVRFLRGGPQEPLLPSALRGVPSAQGLFGTPEVDAVVAQGQQRLFGALSAVYAAFQKGNLSEGELSLLDQAVGQLRQLATLAQDPRLEAFPEIRRKLEAALHPDVDLLLHGAVARLEWAVAAISERDGDLFVTKIARGADGFPRVAARAFDVAAFVGGQDGLALADFRRYQVGDLVAVPRSNGARTFGVVRGVEAGGLSVEVEVNGQVGLKSLTAAEVEKTNPLPPFLSLALPGGRELTTLGVDERGQVRAVMNEGGRARWVDEGELRQLAGTLSQARSRRSPEYLSLPRPPRLGGWAVGRLAATAVEILQARCAQVPYDLVHVENLDAVRAGVAAYWMNESPERTELLRTRLTGNSADDPAFDQRAMTALAAQLHPELIPVDPRTGTWAEEGNRPSAGDRSAIVHFERTVRGEQYFKQFGASNRDKPRQEVALSLLGRLMHSSSVGRIVLARAKGVTGVAIEPLPKRFSPAGSRKLWKDPRYDAALDALRALDYLGAARDRHANNVYCAEPDQPGAPAEVMAIDHETAFGTLIPFAEAGLPFSGGLFPSRYSPEVLAALRELTPQVIRRTFAALLSPAEIEGIVLRRYVLAADVLRKQGVRL